MAKQYSYGICPYIIINGSFFILVNKTSRTSYYNFFKGKIEADETKEQAAIREFYEETGIKVKEEDLEEFFEQKNPRKDIGIFLVDFSKYNHLPFKFEEDEIYSAIWINISKEVEMSKNQKNIFSDIMLHFKPKLKSLRNLYKG
jgi:8-oxo-dGTP pyrophosphatase MutT (NUDIX family)